MSGDGPTDAEILAVGQNPGQQEDRHGRPFIGPSGKLLKGELARAEIGALQDRWTIRFTNLVRCATPNNRAPTPAEIKACRPYLEAEIAKVQPKYILAIGAPSAKALAKRAKITTAHGELVQADGRTVIPLLHPAAVLRSPALLPAFRNDLARFKRHREGTIGAQLEAFKYQVVHTPDDLQAFWRDFERYPEFSLDTETNGLFVHKQDFLIRCISIGLEDKAWVIPMEMPYSMYQGDHKRQEAFVRVLQRKALGKLMCSWNGGYDNRSLRRTYGIGFVNEFDGMLAHHLLDENQDHDLKYVSRTELDCPEYDLPKELKESDHPKWLELIEIPENREKYWAYSARDAWNTLQLKTVLRKRLRASLPLNRLFNHLVMPAARVLEDIELEGLTPNFKRYEEVQARVTLERDQSLKTLNHRAGREINWNSRDQIADVLFIDLKLPVMKETPTGKASTSEEAIVDLKGKHPIINDLLKYRELEKILGTYLEGWKQYIVNGKLYLSYKQHGTVTGRFSSRLHQIPTDGGIRSIIDAPPGWTFCQIDLSQAELRNAAERSGDLALIDIYRKGGDVHWNTVLFLVGAGHMEEYAAQALRTAEELDPHYIRRKGRSLTAVLELLRIAGASKCAAVWKGWKEARTNAKRIAFGFLYGMYENTFVEKAKVDYDWMCTWKEANAFRTGFFEAYPGLPQWHSNCKKLARLDGEVSNMFGRIRRLPAIHSTDRMVRGEAERQAVNAPVQGDIGDWKTAAMIEVHTEVDRELFRIVGEHHDALLNIVKTGWEDQVLPQVRRIVERPKLLKTFKIQMSVPMVADITLGSWGQGTPYKDPK